MTTAVNIKGQTFGLLTVIDRSTSARYPGGDTKTQWLCRCECGNEVIVRTDFLRMGASRSCGCRQGQRYDEVGYMAVHNTLRAEYGPASEYDCVDCSEAADEWSYEGEGTHSEDLSLYQARCTPCHRAYDTRRRVA